MCQTRKHRICISTKVRHRNRVNRSLKIHRIIPTVSIPLLIQSNNQSAHISNWKMVLIHTGIKTCLLAKTKSHKLLWPRRFSYNNTCTGTARAQSDLTTTVHFPRVRIVLSRSVRIAPSLSTLMDCRSFVKRSTPTHGVGISDYSEVDRHRLATSVHRLARTFCYV